MEKPWPANRPVKVQAYSIGGDAISPVLVLPAASTARDVKNAFSKVMGVSVQELDLVLNELQPVRDEALCLTVIKKSRLPEFLRQKRLASLEARAADGSTALHIAARQGELSLAGEILQSNGQLANALDFLGNTALHQAVSSHQEDARIADMCSLLLRRDSSAVMAMNRNRHTVLHLAAMRGHAAACTEILRCFAARKNLLEAKDVYGMTAADMAACAGWPSSWRI